MSLRTLNISVVRNNLYL